MKYTCIIQNININLLFLNSGIRTWFSCKRKITFSVFSNIYKSQCSKIIFIQNHSGCLNRFFFQNRFQEFPMHVITCFSNKCCMCTKFCSCNCYIGRCTSRILGKYILTFRIYSLPGKVNQNLSEGCNIIQRSFYSTISICQKAIFQ